MEERVRVEPAWLNYEDAVTYSSLSRTTIWRLINEGVVVTARVGRRRLINVSSLDGYLYDRALGSVADGEALSGP